MAKSLPNWPTLAPPSPPFSFPMLKVLPFSSFFPLLIPYFDLSSFDFYLFYFIVFRGSRRRGAGIRLRWYLSGELLMHLFFESSANLWLGLCIWNRNFKISVLKSKFFYCEFIIRMRILYTWDALLGGWQIELKKGSSSSMELSTPWPSTTHPTFTVFMVWIATALQEYNYVVLIFYFLFSKKNLVCWCLMVAYDAHRHISFICNGKFSTIPFWVGMDLDKWMK